MSTSTHVTAGSAVMSPSPDPCLRTGRSIPMYSALNPQGDTAFLS